MKQKLKAGAASPNTALPVTEENGRIEKLAEQKKVSLVWKTKKLFFLAGLPELHLIQARMYRCEDTRAGPVSLPLADPVHVSQVMGVA